MKHSKQVPTEATWNNDNGGNWELGTKDKEGKKIGKWRWWRKDGSLLCEAEYDEGKLGTCLRYHPDGTLSWKQLPAHWTAWRSKHPTDEYFDHGGVSESVWSLEMIRPFGSPRYFLEDGTECDSQGKKLLSEQQKKEIEKEVKALTKLFPKNSKNLKDLKLTIFKKVPQKKEVEAEIQYFFDLLNKGKRLEAEKMIFAEENWNFLWHSLWSAFVYLPHVEVGKKWKGFASTGNYEWDDTRLLAKGFWKKDESWLKKLSLNSKSPSFKWFDNTQVNVGVFFEGEYTDHTAEFGLSKRKEGYVLELQNIHIL